MKPTGISMVQVSGWVFVPGSLEALMVWEL